MTEEKGNGYTLKRTGSDIKITVDNEQTRVLAEELARERLKNKSEDPEDLAKKIDQANSEFNTDMFSQATSKDMLKAMIKTKIADLIAHEHHGTPAGSPLVPQQMGEKPTDLWTKSYTSYQEMISDLQKKKAESSKEAESYLNQMLSQWATGKRLNPHADNSYNPNVPEALPQLKGVEGTSAKTPLNPEEGDIGSIMAHWKKERLSRMGKAIDSNGKVIEG